jgi:hypothetical protein
MMKNQRVKRRGGRGGELPLTVPYEPPIPLVPVGAALLSYVLQTELMVSESARRGAESVGRNKGRLDDMTGRLDTLLNDLKQLEEKKKQYEKEMYVGEIKILCFFFFLLLLLLLFIYFCFCVEQHWTS